MKEYIIVPRDPSGSWEKTPRLAIDQPFGEIPEGLAAYAQLCYDDEGLYVHLFAEEKNIRAVEQGPLCAPCEDSCLEFFFSPKNGDSRYFNIEFNLLASSYVGFGSGLTDLMRLLPDDGKPLFDPTARKTPSGWELFYRIPWTFVRRFFPDFRAEKGQSIRANCFKCGDKTDPPHYLSWNEHPEMAPAFHHPEYFGKMIFG